MKIIPSDQFAKDLKRLAKKYPSLSADLRLLQASLLENPTQGVALGDDCYKIGLKIASKNRGKSGGARVVTLVLMLDEEIHLLTMYDKSEVENISDSFLDELMAAAKRR
ncbi:MAG: hypothetical protein ACK4Q5_16615 [Saprospiraceae bacterium]